jgi:hypothetical protein
VNNFPTAGGVQIKEISSGLQSTFSILRYSHPFYDEPMEETIACILNLTDRKEIEQAIRRISLDDSRKLFAHLAKSPSSYAEKVAPILSGLPLSHFVILSQEATFKPYVQMEVLQHKIHLLVGTFREELKISQSKIDPLNREIEALSLPLDPINSSQKGIQSAIQENQTTLHLLNHILELSWLSERVDLIQALSALKEGFIYLLNRLLSLQATLLNRSKSILGSQDDASNLEALASLGFLYLEDFQKFLHLLGEKNEGKPEEEILNLISSRLNTMGLASIKDFKEHELFTKERLFAYLNKMR